MKSIRLRRASSSLLDTSLQSRIDFASLGFYSLGSAITFHTISRPRRGLCFLFPLYRYQKDAIESSSLNTSNYRYFSPIKIQKLVYIYYLLAILATQSLAGLLFEFSRAMRAYRQPHTPSRSAASAPTTGEAFERLSLSSEKQKRRRPTYAQCLSSLEHARQPEAIKSLKCTQLSCRSHFMPT